MYWCPQMDVFLWNFVIQRTVSVYYLSSTWQLSWSELISWCLTKARLFLDMFGKFWLSACKIMQSSKLCSKCESMIVWQSGGEYWSAAVSSSRKISTGASYSFWSLLSLTDTEVMMYLLHSNAANPCNPPFCQIHLLMANHLPQSAPSHLRWCGFEKEKSKIFISPDNHRFPLNLIYWIESVRWPIPLGVVSSSYPPQPRLKCLASSRIRSHAIKSALFPIRSFLALFHHIARKGNLSLLGKEILRWI